MWNVVLRCRCAVWAGSCSPVLTSAFVRRPVWIMAEVRVGRPSVTVHYVWIFYLKAGGVVTDRRCGHPDIQQQVLA
jgi:hypothetical protein